MIAAYLTDVYHHEQQETNSLEYGAIILCGGQSRRMGSDKASLPFGDERMLQRVVRLLSEAVSLDHMAVVTTPDQLIPPLPPGVIVTHDRHFGRGPLEGFLAGLTAFNGQVDAVFVTSCDVPLLVPAFVTRMFELLADFEIAVPYGESFFHPLAAVYRTVVKRYVVELLDADQLRFSLLFDKACTRKVPIEGLRDVDPELRTLMNLNHPEDYQAALELAGLR